MPVKTATEIKEVSGDLSKEFYDILHKSAVKLKKGLPPEVFERLSFGFNGCKVVLVIGDK